MKYILYFLAFSAVFTLSAENETQAQTTHYHYEFTYDAEGNREIRVYSGTAEKSATIGNAYTQKEEEPIIDKVGFNEIKIYPNPTKGNLTVEIPDLEGKTAQITIYNLNGKLIKNKKVSTNSRENVNLTQFPSGMYLMKITIGVESSDWKIIKD